MMPRTVVALLGRRDNPTDAVQEYCGYLGTALQKHGFALQIRRVPWESLSWRGAVDALRLQAAQWCDTWVLVQYTALAWSSRGFPRRFLEVLEILKSAGAFLGVVYHDVEPYHGTRFVDRLRRHDQVRTMRRASQLVDLAIFTVPLSRITWLSDPAVNAHFVPVGANLPIPDSTAVNSPVASPANSSGLDSGRSLTGSTVVPSACSGVIPTIGVFSITGGQAGAQETKLIVAAVRHASQKLGKVCLSVFGRHAELHAADLRRELQDVPVELSVEGVLEPEQVVQRLCACDVLLFVRGEISSRRGSAIAGIACGLPVIAFSGSETGQPITDAGVVFVHREQPAELQDALVRILSDKATQKELAIRSRAVYESHLSWSAIAARFAALLRTK